MFSTPWAAMEVLLKALYLNHMFFIFSTFEKGMVERLRVQEAILLENFGGLCVSPNLSGSQNLRL